MARSAHPRNKDLAKGDRRPYVFDPKSRVWLRPDADRSGPADGEAQRVASLLRETKDIACGSEQLQAAVQDWTTLYHLSPERANLLQPVRSLLHGRLLEIGAECGAITRFLGETGCATVALEEDFSKAAAAAARCSGLDNVAVYCDRLSDAVLEGKFDCVVVIGALERAGKTTDPAGAMRDLLERCASLLGGDGLLLLAAENALALKYFAGAPGERGGGIFHGISGFAPAGVRPLGKAELERELAGAGFRHKQFLYPLPDYRLARLVLSAEAFRPENRDLATDLVQRFSAFYDPRWSYERLFSERLAWASVLRNGLGEEFAPAFFVLAAKKPRPLAADALAYTYSTTRRRCFQKENILTRREAKLLVLRRRLYAAAAPEGGVSRQELRNEDYCEGRLWANELYARLDTPGWTFQTILDWFRPYFDFLARHSQDRAGRRVLAPNFLDCTPFNVVRGSGGEFEPFDLEWVARDPVPLDWLLFRGLLYTLNGTVTVAAPQGDPELRILSLTAQFMERVGEPVSDERMERLFELEEEQQKCAAGGHAAVSREYWKKARLTPRVEDVRAELARRDSVLAETSGRLRGREGELAAIQRELEDRAREAALLDRQAAQNEERAAAAEERLAGLDAEFQSLSRTMAELAAAIGRRDEDLALRARQAEELEQRIRQRDGEAKELALEVASAREGLEAIETAWTESRSSLAESQARAAALEERAGVREGRIQELAGEAEGARTALDRANAELAETRTRVLALEGEASLRQERIGKLSGQLDELRTALRASDGELARSGARTMALEAEARLSERRIGELSGKCAELQAAAAARDGQLSEQRRAILDQQAALGSLQERLRAGAQRTEDLAQALAGERNQRARLEGEIARQRELLDENASRAQRLLSELEELRAGKAAAERTCLRLDQDLNRIRQSWLFRLAGLLRISADPARAASKAVAPLSSKRTASAARYAAARLWMAGRCRSPKCRRALETIRKNRSFDAAYYTLHNPDVAMSGLPPLAHYVVWGAAEGRSPNAFSRRSAPLNQSRRGGARSTPEIEVIQPFFDVEFYVKQCPELARGDACPFAHYLARGAKEGKNPHPLFDSRFYLERNPDVARDDANPLLHYARFGAREGRDPHPLFDTSYYLEKYGDIAASDVSPLLHYIAFGYAEGRSPNRLFDGGYYWRENPDVAANRANPLVHYLEWGAREGRNPHPAFDTRLYLEQHPEAAGAGINPLIHYFAHARATASQAEAEAPPAAGRRNRRSGCFTVGALAGAGKLSPFAPARTVLCVTHVPPYPPRAGNEYLIYRQLACLERNGYRIVLAVAPLAGEEISLEQLRVLCGRFPYTILCGRDGLIEHRLPDGGAVLDALDGVVPLPLASEIGEDLVTGEEERSLVGTERAFCHDFLARLALHLETALEPAIVLAEYIFQTRFLPLVSRHSLKIVQTHDMFSSKRRKVVEFGVSDTLSLTAEQERRRLLRADLILACQREEALAFARLVPERQVLAVPVDFDVASHVPPAQGSKILYVASDNPLNVKGLRDFLRLAWPLILREAPEAELLVAGKICRAVPRAPENVRLLGLADSLEPLYEQARLTINPSVAGTGLKIKVVESLSHFRPVVCWPSGVDGFQPELAALCRIARDWPEFAAAAVAILDSPQAEWFSREQQLRIRHLLSPATVYGPLLQHLDAWCERRGLPPAKAKAAAGRGSE